MTAFVAIAVLVVLVVLVTAIVLDGAARDREQYLAAPLTRKEGSDNE